MKLTRQKIRALVVEELRLRTEADTQEMEPVDLSKTLRQAAQGSPRSLRDDFG